MMRLKVNSTTNIALDMFLSARYPEYGIYAAYNDGEIFVGYLRKDEDDTWDEILTYYYNSNYRVSDVSIRKNKI